MPDQLFTVSVFSLSLFLTQLQLEQQNAKYRNENRHLKEQVESLRLKLQALPSSAAKEIHRLSQQVSVCPFACVFVCVCLTSGQTHWWYICHCQCALYWLSKAGFSRDETIFCSIFVLVCLCSVLSKGITLA